MQPFSELEPCEARVEPAFGYQLPSCTPVAPEAETPTDSEANAAYRRNICAVLGC